jgi:ectoine hydroxylase-related dioxygenase (phytanoyl-CoA dioxygenase family)
MDLLTRIDAEALAAYRAAFARDGVVCVERLLDDRCLALLAATVAAAIAQPSPYIEVFGAASRDGRERFFADANLARFASFESFLTTSPVPELVASLMESAVARLFFEQVLVKEPGAGKRTPWHQDLPYWPIDGGKICSTWIPIDPVPKSVGVEFLAGSHRWTEHSPCDFQDGLAYGHSSLPRLSDIDAERGKHTILAFDMKPGDCLVFHAMTVHGAPGNASRTSRRAVSIRWAGDDSCHRHRAGLTEERSIGAKERDGLPLDDGEYPQYWPRLAPA